MPRTKLCVLALDVSCLFDDLVTFRPDRYKTVGLYEEIFDLVRVLRSVIEIFKQVIQVCHAFR